MKITVSQLRRIIREEVQKNLSLKSPDPDRIYEKFIELRDENGEVPVETLAAELGVTPDQIDWSARTSDGMGTGLRVYKGVVSELI